MARKVRNSSLENRSARARLKTAHKPYYRLIEPGCMSAIARTPAGLGPGLCAGTPATATTRPRTSAPPMAP